MITALALNNISFDIFVLSWPAIHVANEHADAAALSVRAHDGSPPTSQKANTYFDFDNFPPNNDVIAQLPHLASIYSHLNSYTILLTKRDFKFFHSKLDHFYSKLGNVFFKTLFVYCSFFFDRALGRKPYHNSVSLIRNVSLLCHPSF